MSSIKALKEQLEKVEASIMDSIKSISSRLEHIEEKDLVANNQGGDTDKKEILNKIESTGIEITTANEKVTGELREEILKIKDVVITNLYNDNRKLRNRVSVLEKQVIENEKRFNEMDLHNRKVNVEIEGIPNSVEQKDLKEYAVQVFRHAGIDPVSNNDIEVIHRLRSKKKVKTVIIKAKRDFIDKVYEKKKEIGKVAKDNLNLKDTTFYVNPSLSSYSHSIAYNCRVLKRKGLIADTWVNNGKIKIKMLDNQINVIWHEIDLFELFQDFNEFSFNTERYAKFFSEDSCMESYNDLSGYA